MGILVLAETAVETFNAAERIYYRRDAPLLGVRQLPGGFYPDGAHRHATDLVRTLTGVGVTVHRVDGVVTVNDGLERLGFLDPDLTDEVRLARVVHQHRLLTWTTVAGRGGDSQRCSCDSIRAMSDATWSEHLAQALIAAGVRPALPQTGRNDS